eukprot:11381049-Prorocentrum_lima.AAC.1
MEEHLRDAHIPNIKDGPICQQAQGQVVRHYQHPTRFEHIWNATYGFDKAFGNRPSWKQICADHRPQ